MEKATRTTSSKTLHEPGEYRRSHVLVNANFALKACLIFLECFWTPSQSIFPKSKPFWEPRKMLFKPSFPRLPYLFVPCPSLVSSPLPPLHPCSSPFSFAFPPPFSSPFSLAFPYHSSFPSLAPPPSPPLLPFSLFPQLFATQYIGIAN